MSRKGKNDRNSFITSAGWLFADMLLALTMLFLVANTLAVKPLTTRAKSRITPVPTKVKITPTPTPIPTQLPRLELSFHEFTINVDSQGLLNNSQSAINSVKQQVKAQPVLRGRSVGLVIAYGGAPDDSQIPTAQAIAGKVYNALRSFGKGDSVFGRASYYDTLYLLGGNPNKVTLDIYLFAK